MSVSEMCLCMGVCVYGAGRDSSRVCKFGSSENRALACQDSLAITLGMQNQPVMYNSYIHYAMLAFTKRSLAWSFHGVP